MEVISLDYVLVELTRFGWVVAGVKILDNE
jgi:hypothetical protein